MKDRYFAITSRLKVLIKKSYDNEYSNQVMSTTSTPNYLNKAEQDLIENKIEVDLIGNMDNELISFFSESSDQDFDPLYKSSSSHSNYHNSLQNTASEQQFNKIANNLPKMSYQNIKYNFDKSFDCNFDLYFLTF